MNTLLLPFIQMILLATLAPLALGVVRKTKAVLQGRRGASVFLVYRSIRTLWQKETMISETASWVYRIVPPTVFCLAIGLGFIMPLLITNASGFGAGSLFVVAGMLMLGSVMLILGGLDTGGAFGGMASSREMTIASLVEPAILTMFGAFALSVSLVPSDLIGVFGWNLSVHPELALAVGALILVALAENARFPVDNPATHLELTMVHEGMILEYSGRHLALLEWASAAKLTVFGVFIANTIFPYGLLAADASLALLPVALGVVILKLIVVMMLLGLLETSIAKMRFYRMQEYLSAAALLGIGAMFAAIF
jgi:formate hydrogenlyase subunit 4